MQVVLGTESGMITSIVNKVQSILAASGRRDVDVEIVFPVAEGAITTDRSPAQVLPVIQVPLLGKVTFSPRASLALQLRGTTTFLPGMLTQFC